MDALLEKPDKTPTFHVTTINDLPNAIMEDIFIQLSTKSCFQCMCVSKRWKKLLCSANFAHRFLCYPMTDPNSHKRTEGDDLYLLEGSMPLIQINQKCLEDFKALPFPLKLHLHPKIRIQIVATCGDLLLCRGRGHGDNKNHHVSCFSYYIGNPMSQRWVKLPPLHGAGKNHLAGFVFDEKRFVVVHLTIHTFSQANMWKLSSSSSEVEASWLSFPTSYPDILRSAEFSSYILSHNDNLVSLNGCLYLAAQKGVLEFNPTIDSWNFFPYGFKVVSHYDSFRIESCEGVLCLSQLNASYKYAYYRVWELKEDCNKGNKRVWYLKRNVKFDKISSSSNGECSWRIVMNFHHGYGERMYMRWNSFTALCKLKEKTVQLVGRNKVDFSIGLFSTWALTRYGYGYRYRYIHNYRSGPTHTW